MLCSFAGVRSCPIYFTTTACKALSSIERLPTKRKRLTGIVCSVCALTSAALAAGAGATSGRRGASTLSWRSIWRRTDPASGSDCALAFEQATPTQHAKITARETPSTTLIRTNPSTVAGMCTLCFPSCNSVLERPSHSV